MCTPCIATSVLRVSAIACVCVCMSACLCVSAAPFSPHNWYCQCSHCPVRAVDWTESRDRMCMTCPPPRFRGPPPPPTAAPQKPRVHTPTIHQFRRALAARRSLRRRAPCKMRTRNVERRKHCVSGDDDVAMLGRLLNDGERARVHRVRGSTNRNSIRLQSITICDCNVNHPNPATPSPRTLAFHQQAHSLASQCLHCAGNGANMDTYTSVALPNDLSTICSRSAPSAR